jgi:hypothetical protein
MYVLWYAVLSSFGLTAVRLVVHTSSVCYSSCSPHLTSPHLPSSHLDSDLLLGADPCGAGGVDDQLNPGPGLGGHKPVLEAAVQPHGG